MLNDLVVEIRSAAPRLIALKQMATLIVASDGEVLG
jgi:hypothetical protein